MDPETIGKVAIIAVASTASFTAIGMAVHYYLHRVANRLPTPTNVPLNDERFARLELAVESIAIEVERITEGQRFLTKLQTSAPDPIPLPRRATTSERREITPVT
ncbi:MAG: hypothetical protein H7099_12620 [Gemmatimonadaceae bacterium]|nr:hypothetical protein [Gemmatimonadaceae bacterium]